MLPDAFFPGPPAFQIPWEDLPVGLWLHSAVVATARIVFAIGVAWVAVRVLSRVVEGMRRRWVRARDALAAHAPHGYGALLATRREEFHRRSQTVARIIREAIRAFIVVVTISIVAEQTGFDTTAVLGAAALASLTVGMAARSLVRDFVTGLFLLAEGQMRVGDSVSIGKISGAVEEISLRRVKLRSGDGAVHIVPNGAIGAFANSSFRFSWYAWNLGLAYDADPDESIAALAEIGREFRRHPRFGADILEDLEILGVDQFADYAVFVRMRIRTLPGKQGGVGRAINRRILEVFQERGIPLAAPATTWYLGSQPQALCADGIREAIRLQVRDLLGKSPALPPADPAGM